MQESSRAAAIPAFSQKYPRAEGCFVEMRGRGAGGLWKTSSIYSW